MLEKFDNSRIRFKRPRSARARDAYLPAGVDPYRTRYGTSSARYAVLASVLIGLVVLGLGVLGLSLEKSVGALSRPAVVPALIALTIVVLGILLLFVRRR
ncbi:MAG: hypothetical protein ISS50_05825 [Anaerolineae bacterium]|nr:hypothetical protein [Anaerolineae bacterium]